MIDSVMRICLRREDFRMEFGGVFQLIFGLTLVLTEAFFWLNGSPVYVMLTVLPLLLAVLSAIVSGLICLAFHFEVGPRGLDAYTLLNAEHIAWSDVRASRRVSFLGLDWLVIRTQDNRRPLWLPLFVNRYALLRELLITFSDPRCHWDETLPKV